MTAKPVCRHGLSGEKDRARKATDLGKQAQKSKVQPA